MHTYAAESIELRDPKTGRRVIQLTSAPAVHHHLYFLTASLTADEEEAVFCSYRTGAPQYYVAGFPTGEIRQLTDVTGLNGFSGILAADSSELFYTVPGQIQAVDLTDGETRVVAEFEEGQLGECSLSADGAWLVTACRRSGKYGLAIAAVDGSTAWVMQEQDRTIIHPQFHPRDPDWIEYAGDPAPRMWIIRRDGTDNTCLYEHDNQEFLVHETFLGDAGSELIVSHWPYALRRFHIAERRFRDIARFNAWHIASTRDGTTVLCDTAHPDTGLRLVDVATGRHELLCEASASCGGSQWKKDYYAVAADFAAAREAAERDASLSWMEMKVDTVYGPQWTHPHPSFSPSEKWVLFTSDRTGHSQVYAVER